MAVSIVRPGVRSPSESLLTSLYATSQTVMHRLLLELRPLGLTNPQFWNLQRLLVWGPQTLTELSSRCGVSAPSVSVMIDQLEKDGYVRRRRTADDRRKVLIEITSKGEKLIGSVWRRFGVVLDSITETLPRNDVAATARTLSTIAERIGPPRRRLVEVRG